MRRAFVAAFIGLLLPACGQSEMESSLSANLRNSSAPYPQNPHPDMTPGDTCDDPDEYRYPERIKYCNRSVGSGLKAEIIKEYDERFGHRIQEMNRRDFKIDHYIPLCMGGSNDKENLWPQHKTVYVTTDPLEGKMCELMAKGAMKQAEGIELIKRAKNYLNEAPEIERVIDERLGN